MVATYTLMCRFTLTPGLPRFFCVSRQRSPALLYGKTFSPKIVSVYLKRTCSDVSHALQDGDSSDGSSWTCSSGEVCEITYDLGTMESLQQLRIGEKKTPFGGHVMQMCACVSLYCRVEIAMYKRNRPFQKKPIAIRVFPYHRHLIGRMLASHQMTGPKLCRESVAGSAAIPLRRSESERPGVEFSYGIADCRSRLSSFGNLHLSAHLCSWHFAKPDCAPCSFSRPGSSPVKSELRPCPVRPQLFDPQATAPTDRCW